MKEKKITVEILTLKTKNSIKNETINLYSIIFFSKQKIEKVKINKQNKLTYYQLQNLSVI